MVRFVLLRGKMVNRARINVFFHCLIAHRIWFDQVAGSAASDDSVGNTCLAMDAGSVAAAAGSAAAVGAVADAGSAADAGAVVVAVCRLAACATS